MKISYEWAMPSKDTFLIKPIKDLVLRYVGDGIGWLDPFAGENSPAEFTNDINPLKPTKYHFNALEFAQVMEGKFKGALFDPPYSLRQAKECYEGAGVGFGKLETNYCVHHSDVKDVLSDKISPGGIVISCGWNSTGFGKKRGFKKIEMLIVNHGGSGHNDTIITVEHKLF